MHLHVATELLSNANSEECERSARDALLRNLTDCGEAACLERIDIGRGASADAFKVILDWLPTLSPIALFFLGSQIEKNFDAWISLSRRLRTLVGSLRVLGHHTVVTFEAACAIALDEVVANEWHKPGFEIDHAVLSNKRVQIHTAFPSMAGLKEYVEADRKWDFDPLANEAIYTFFGRSEGKLFIVSVDGQGTVLLSKQLNQ